MSELKTPFMNSRMSMNQWPIHISKFRKDFYAHTQKRGFTQEEVQRMMARGQWKKGEWVTEAQHDVANAGP